MAISLPNSLRPKNDLLANDRYMQAVSDMATRIDRILSGQETVTVRTTVSGPNVPAFQSGANLYLVPSVIRDMIADPSDEREVLPLLLALNMHEYGHFEYTASPTNQVWQREKSRVGPGVWQGIFKWLNLCEDQRQELLVSTRFPRARHYFRLATLRGMLAVQRKRGSIPPENFLLYYGRRHILPRPLLARLETALVAKYSAPVVEEAKGLIDEFVRLASTTDYALRRQWEIAETLRATFGQNMPTGNRECLLESQIGARTSKADQEKRTKQAGDMLDKIDEKQKENAERDAQREAAQDKTPEETNDDNDGDSASKDQTKDESETADKQGSDDSDKPEDKPDENDENKSEDAGDELEDLEDDGELDQFPGEDSDDADTGEEDSEDNANGKSGDSDDGDDELEQELEDYIDRADTLASGELAGRSDQIAAEIFRGPAAKLANVLKQVSTDLGMVDHARLKAGKLDIRRIPAAVAIRETRIFRDRRQNLKREASMLVHILLDSSGSMNANRQTAIDATATIARAADLADHRGKVTTFSSAGDSAVLKEWAALELDRAKVTWFSGGTDPSPVLDTVVEDFRKAQVAFKCFNRILLIVTDGEFDDEQAQAERFTALKRAGVHTFLIGIGITPGEYGGTWTYPIQDNGNFGKPVKVDGKKYDVDGALQINTVNDLETAMRIMLRKLAVQIAHDVTARY